MKKWLALFLSLCLALTMTFAAAEGVETELPDETSADGLESLMNLLGTDGESVDLSGLLGMFGSEEGEDGDMRGLLDLFTSEGGEEVDLSGLLGMFGSEEGEGVDLSGLLGMFGSEEGEGVDLSGLLGMFGSEEGEGVDLSGLLGMLGSEDGEGIDLSGLLGMFGSEEGEGIDLSGLLGMFGSEDGESVDLSGLLGMFGSEGGEGIDLSGLLGLLGGNEEPVRLTEETENPLNAHDNIVAAESKEAFFGVWALSKAVIAGTEVTAADLAEIFGDVRILVKLAQDSLTFSIGEKESVIAVAAELANGALNLTAEGETMPVYLTSEGELLICLGSVDIYFTAVE